MDPGADLLERLPVHTFRFWADPVAEADLDPKLPAQFLVLARCTIAGGVGITGHLRITDGVHITAMSLISKSIEEPGAYSSGTAMGATRDWRKNAVRFLQLDQLFRRVSELEKKKQ